MYLAPAAWGKPMSLAFLVGVRYVLRLGLRRWQARITALWKVVDARGMVAADVQALAGRYAVAQWQASRPECARFLPWPAVLHRVFVQLSVDAAADK